MNFKNKIFIILLVVCVSATTVGKLGLFSTIHLHPDPTSSCFPACWH